MESENTHINSKISIICNNEEGDWILVHLNLQSLIECSRICSNGCFFSYLMEEESNYMPNKEFVHKDCSDCT